MGIMGLSCIFPVPNIKKTAEFYVSKLEFSAVEYLECKEPHICLYKDSVEIILLQSNTDMATMRIYIQKIRNHLKKSSLKRA